MQKKAIIFDLDNTIYSVASIAGELFPPLFKLLAESGELDHRLEAVQDELQHRPYQQVAKDYGFSPELTAKGLRLLENLSYGGPIFPFADYALVQHLNIDKFLVTSGFYNLQYSKIRGMGIEQDFKEIHIVDVDKATKKEVFAGILHRHNFQREEVLLIGDDPKSEIKAAQQLGLDAVLYNKQGRFEAQPTLDCISSYADLHRFL